MQIKYCSVNAIRPPRQEGISKGVSTEFYLGDDTTGQRVRSRHGRREHPPPRVLISVTNGRKTKAPRKTLLCAGLCILTQCSKGGKVRM